MRKIKYARVTDGTVVVIKCWDGGYKSLYEKNRNPTPREADYIMLQKGFRRLRK